MKISKNEIDALNASLHITIETSDYEEKFNKELGDYRKKAQMKGFRKGKTPLSAVKKMYGKSLLASAVNDILGESLNNYLIAEKLNVLGQPIPSDEQPDIDFDIKELKDFVFVFDIGLSPDFEVQGLDDKLSMNVVEVPEETVTEEVEMARRRFGSEIFPEDSIEENDLVTLHAVELDGDNIKEKGWETGFSVLVKLLNDEVKADLLTKKVGDTFRFDVYTIEKDKDEKHVRKYLLNLDPEEEKEIGNFFEGTIEKVSRIESAPLDQDFFDKFMGEGAVSSEEEVREKIRESISSHYNQQTKNLLFREIMDHLMEKNRLELPEEFLKRWIKLNNENATDEVIADEFDAFSDNLRWNLIKEKLEVKFDVKVEAEDIKRGFKNRIATYFGGNIPQGIDLDKMADSMMSNQEQFNQVYNEEKADKLFHAIHEAMDVEEKPISLEDFQALVKKINAQDS